jgi:transposase
MKRKQYTAAFKAQVVQEILKEEKSIAQLASEYSVHPTQLNQWKATALAGLASLFERHDSAGALKAEYEEKLTEAYAEVGRLTTQMTWLKKKSGVELVER